MTDKKPHELIPLAKSWLYAPKMGLISDGYEGGSYDQSERAYLIEKKGPGNLTPCTFVLEASKNSPLLNPAIIIKNWGNHLSKLTVDGQEMTQGKDFRQGIRKGPVGEDLILWIKLDSQKPVKITLGRAGKREY